MTKYKYDFDNILDILQKRLDAALNQWPDMIPPEGETIVIYAAGHNGRTLKQVYLKGLNIPIKFYWDKRYNEIKQIDDVIVLKPFEEHDKLDKNIRIYICLYDKDEREKVDNQLRELGFSNIYHYYDVTQIMYARINRCKKNEADEECLMCGQSISIDCRRFFKHLYDTRLSLTEEYKRGYETYPILEHNSRLVTGITMECNNYCHSCPYTEIPQIRFEKFGRVNKEQYLRNVKKIASVTSFIYKLFIGTGESLMFQDDLLDILKELVNIKKILTIQVITNGSIMPKPELLEFISANNWVISFAIDDYKIHEKPVKPVLDKLDEYSIAYSITKWDYSDWYDYRRIGEVCLSDEQLKGKITDMESENYCEAATHGICMVFNTDYLTCRCGCQYYYALYNGIPLSESPDFINIAETPVEELAEKILDLHNNRDYYEGCRGCIHGMHKDKSFHVPAGQQLTRDEIAERKERYLKSKSSTDTNSN